MLNFTSNVYGKTVHLDWQTASEVNTSHFVVERSSDGVRFEDIGKVDAAGNSSERKSYAFQDKDAMNMNANKIFYRLKMLDNDKKVTYSKVLPVHKRGEKQLLVYPNPAVDNLKLLIHSLDRQHVVVNIFDESGRKVYSQSVNIAAGNNSHIINVASFSKGSYYINVEAENGVETGKFVKN